MQLIKSGKFTQTVAKAGLKLKKESPLILTIAGGVGLLATAYLAYKSAPKVEKIVTEMETRQADIALYERSRLIMMFPEQAHVSSTPEIGEAESAFAYFNQNPHLLDFNRAEYMRRIVGAVALPVCTAVLSVTSIAMSYKIMNGRVGTLTSVVSALTAEAAKKNERMKEVLSEEDYKAVMAPVEKTTVETTDGKVVEGDAKRANHDFSCAWYSDSSEFVKDDHQYNMTNISTAERKIDEIMGRKGFILLNQVYDVLGLERTKEGMLMGWDQGDFFSFGIDIVNTVDQAGDFFPEILIKWPIPHYIYEDVDLEGRYAVI